MEINKPHIRRDDLSEVKYTDILGQKDLFSPFDLSGSVKQRISIKTNQLGYSFTSKQSEYKGILKSIIAQAYYCERDPIKTLKPSIYFLLENLHFSKLRHEKYLSPLVDYIFMSESNILSESGAFFESQIKEEKRLKRPESKDLNKDVAINSIPMEHKAKDNKGKGGLEKALSFDVEDNRLIKKISSYYAKNDFSKYVRIMGILLLDIFRHPMKDTKIEVYENEIGEKNKYVITRKIF